MSICETISEKVQAGRAKEVVTLINEALEAGITADPEKCMSYIKGSIGIVTALNPYIGYKHSTKIAKKAKETGRGVYDIVLEEGILSKEQLDEILKPENMIKPVKLDIKPL